METSLFIEETQDTPKIVLDPANGIFEISGRSMPEDALKFYAPVLQWLEEYVNIPNQATNFDFILDYFNSASTKKIFEIITVLERLHKKNHSVTVVWFHCKEDELIKNRGIEVKEMVELPFEIRVD